MSLDIEDGNSQTPLHEPTDDLNDLVDADEATDFWAELEDRYERLKPATIDNPQDLEVLTASDLCGEWGCTMETLRRVLRRYPLIIEHRRFNRLGTYQQLQHVWEGRDRNLRFFDIEREALFRRSAIEAFKDEYGKDLAGIIKFDKGHAPIKRKSRSGKKLKAKDIPDRVLRKFKAITVWQVLHDQDPKRSIRDIWLSDEMFRIVHQPLGKCLGRDSIPADTTLRDWLREAQLLK